MADSCTAANQVLQVCGTVNINKHTCKPACKHIPTHRLSQPYVSSEGRPETVRGGIIKGLGQAIWLVHGDEEKLTHYAQQKK